MRVRTTLLLTLWAAVACAPPPSDAEANGDPILAIIPPPQPPKPTLLERYDLRKLTAEALFPERARQDVLIPASPGGTPDVMYSYDACDLTDTATLRAKNRVTFAELGPIGAALNRTLASGGTCAAPSCFLQVNTAHQGRSVTISAASTIACEDPDRAALGECGLGMATITDENGPRPLANYRGNVIVADVIRVEGTVTLGSLSLVLVAREAIEFAEGAVINGAETLSVATGAAGTALPSHPAIPTGCSINYCPTFPYTSITGGSAGARGHSSGSVVLVTPEVRTPIDRYSALLNPYHTVLLPMVSLRGGPGGEGGRAGSGICRKGDDACDASVRALARSGGAGGAGGAAGNLIVIADRVTGSGLEGMTGTPFAGGLGGRGALGTQLTRYDLATILPRHEYLSVGAVGAAGASGAAGYRHDLTLGTNYPALAFQLARRGLDRRLINARHYARSPDAADVPRARELLADGIDLYCHAFPAPAPTFGTKPTRIVPPASGRPTTYVIAQTVRAQVTACRELEERWTRTAYGRNYFGFPSDFVMYLRPDVVKDFRDRLLGNFDVVRQQFTDAVNAQSASEAVRSARVVTLTDQLVNNDSTLVEKEQAAEIKRQRYEALAEAALTKLGWYKLNNDEIASLRAQVEAGGGDVEAALQLRPSAPCDFWCVLGNVVTTAIQIGTLIANTASAIATISDFISNLDTIFDMNRIFDELKTAGKITLPIDRSPEGFLADMQVLSAYGQAALKGIESSKTPGINAVVTDTKAALEAWKAVAPPSPSSPDIGDLVRKIAYNTEATQRELREVLLNIHTAIATVEALDPRSVVDKPRALGTLEHMVGLVESQIDLSRNNGRLFDEHLMALAEMSIAENELVLAMVELDHAREYKTRLQCQLGRIWGAQCAGVAAVGSSSARIGVLRDEACRASRTIGDSVLLADYFYQRSRDFVLLTERGTAADPSRDFRRNFLVPSQRTAFVLGTTHAYNDDFLATFADPSLPDGTIHGDVCLPGEPCAGNGGEAYQGAVMSSLLARGRTEVEVDADCHPNQPDSRCNAGLGQELPKQRVANFDVRLVMAPGYRLGCLTPTGCPAATPADAPMLTGAQYVVDYQHEDRATFLWTDGTYRSFLFTQSYPRQACEVVKAYATVPFDCRDLAFFGGTADYFSTFSEPLSTYGRSDVDPAMYGSSVRGRWTIDINRTLLQLNGPAGDGCYTPDSSDGARLELSDSCLPDSCLSPCFDATGARRDPRDPSTPLSCGCYDANLALIPRNPLLRRPECDGLAPQLTRVRADAPAVCGGGSATATDLEALCRPYVSSGQNLQLHGDLACCTASGHQRLDLSASAATACTLGGWTSDDACSVPEPCLEICGPRCKAFKAALRGFTYAIHWRAR